MDKNTITAIALIGLILIGFSWLNKPSQEEIARQQRYNDSINIVQQQQSKDDLLVADTAAEAEATATLPDSVKNTQLVQNFGAFANAATGTEEFYTLENELVKIVVSSKGGRIYSAELKNYTTHDSLPLMLFDNDESTMAFTFATNDTKIVSSKDLYFQPVGNVTADAQGNQNLVMRLASADSSYLDIAYTLPPSGYMLSFALKGNNLNRIMPLNTNSLEMVWNAKVRQQEHGKNFEARYSQITYKFAGDDVEKLSESKNAEKTEMAKIHWIAYKDQFFSTVLIADTWFTDTKMLSTVESEHSPYLKSYESSTTVPFDLTGSRPTTFKMYVGPNQYKILNDCDEGLSGNDKLYLRRLVPLGWGIFGWVNRFFTVPVFNVLSLFISNFGIIILLLTLIVKMLLFPLTYKSYMSSAKMRVLKPEIDEINAKIPADKPQERQKATMSLYSKVGVSPMSGCLPMLIQMPVLIALFSFFPSAIELRQQSFLWATDLSSYDSIFTLPFSIPFGYGNHVSLFCLLMAAATIVSTKLNQQTQPMSDQPGMGMMKWMMYLMPIFFLFMFNNYASGLTYYYFLSTLITVVQMYVIRAFVDEKKLLAQLHSKRDSKTAGASKKTSFMERLEKMQREQQKAVKQQGKKKK